MRYVFLLFLLGFPLYAQAHNVHCTLRTMVTDNLTTLYRESVVAVGKQPDGDLVEIWANLDTKTFTIVVTPQDKRTLSCLLSGGKEWQTTGQLGIMWQPWDSSD